MMKDGFVHSSVGEVVRLGEKYFALTTYKG